MIPWYLLQGRHLSGQQVPPVCTTDCLQLPLILLYILHSRLILRGHDVTDPETDIVEDGTCCDDL